MCKCVVSQCNVNRLWMPSGYVLSAHHTRPMCRTISQSAGLASGQNVNPLLVLTIEEPGSYRYIRVHWGCMRTAGKHGYLLPARAVIAW